MKIKVFFFATLRDIVGEKNIDLEFPPKATIKDLKETLIKMYPRLKAVMKTVLVAINHEYGFDESSLPDGAEVAIFPPVSGG